MKQNYYLRNSDDYIYGALMRESTTTYSTPQTRVIHVVMITASCQSPRTDPITAVNGFFISSPQHPPPDSECALRSFAMIFWRELAIRKSTKCLIHMEI
jgi:hypothetical protein